MEELNIRELIAKPLFAEGGIGDRLFKAYHAYAEDYILATEGPDYAPTEFERELIKDFINGLFSDEQFLAPILALLSSAEAREEAEGWLYTSDDGVEWSDNHPVESGEVSDARDIRPATAKALLHELTAAWETYHEQRVALQSAEARAREAEARVERGWLPIVLCPTDGVDRALLLPDGREVVGAHHNPGGWRVCGDPIEYDAVQRDWSGAGLLTDKPQPQREPPVVGTVKRTMNVYGPLPDGVYPTHFRPNDTVYRAALQAIGASHGRSGERSTNHD